MDHFRYIDGTAHCEAVPLKKIAERVGTPAYVYSRATLVRHCTRLTSAFNDYPTLACFAVKANSNVSVLREIGRLGFGADVVSVGELERALVAGIPGSRIVYSGVGKRRDEIERAFAAEILSFNVESDFELRLVETIAKERRTPARVSLRINPNIDAKTHPKISTGLYSTKFGMTEGDARALVRQFKSSPHLRFVGVGCHIGSQITEIGPLAMAAERMVAIAREFQAEGLPLEILDMGGGLGIRYDDEDPPTLEAYAKTLISAVKPTGLRLVVEPGRVIVGNIGVIVTSVMGVKTTPDRAFVMVDAAMNDLLRPSIYGSWHEILPVDERLNTAPKQLTDVVGPICETGDFLGKDRQLAAPEAGALMMIRSCGAYSSSMASTYNSRPRAPEILVDGDTFRVIRPRENLADLWKPEIVD